MDRFFAHINDEEKELGVFNIVGEDVKHISKVLRYNIGDKLEVCDYNNEEYICSIKEINKDYIKVIIDEKVEINRESSIKVRLYQGLPKSSKMEIILQKLTECGVSEIILVDTERSVVNLDDKKIDKKIERWERIIYEAAKQSKRGIIPKLRGVISFKEYLNEVKLNDVNICPYEDENTMGIKKVLNSEILKQIISKKSEVNVGIFIGPEGGFSPTEIEKIKENGVFVVSMGPRIFRTETASIVSTSIVLYELGDIGLRK